MKRRCVDPECNKKFVISKVVRSDMKEAAPYGGDENLCPQCFKEVCDIYYDQSYWGSFAEWGA